MNQMDTSALCRPVVYITVRNPKYRAQLADALHREGWAVIEQPTGFHLIQAIADVIEGHPWRKPELIVIDAIAPGCAGTTIAAGLRDLGVDIPIVLIGAPGYELDDGLRVVSELARQKSPLYMFDGPRSHRASA